MHREEDSTRNVTFSLSASWVERTKAVGIFLAAATLVLFLKWAFGELNEQGNWGNLFSYAIPAYFLAVLTCFRSAAGRQRDTANELLKARLHPLTLSYDQDTLEWRATGQWDNKEEQQAYFRTCNGNSVPSVELLPVLLGSIIVGWGYAMTAVIIGLMWSFF